MTTRSPVVLVALVALVALATTAACQPLVGGRGVDDRTRSAARVDAARTLDQLGVRSFRAGRYNDAAAYFRDAYQLGGPSSELWNIVRCLEGKDDAEGAADAITDYLAVKDLAPQDRADAQREAAGLRLRPSTLTVTTAPPGAVVLVDGNPAPGPTPISLEVRAGAHTVAVRSDGYVPVSQSIEARFGRVVIVSLDLGRRPK